MTQKNEDQKNITVRIKHLMKFVAFTPEYICTAESQVKPQEKFCGMLNLGLTQISSKGLS